MRWWAHRELVTRAESGFGCSGSGIVRVVGEGGLVAQGSLQESVGGVSLAGTSDSAAPKAAELGRVDRITGDGYVGHVGACKYRSWEGGREAQDLAALFEDLFAQNLELLGC